MLTLTSNRQKDRNEREIDKGEVIRKAQQSCREQPGTPSSASGMMQGEQIKNDNKGKPSQEDKTIPGGNAHVKNRGCMAKHLVKMQKQTEDIQHWTPLCHPLSGQAERKTIGDT